MLCSRIRRQKYPNLEHTGPKNLKSQSTQVQNSHSCKKNKIEINQLINELTASYHEELQDARN